LTANFAESAADPALANSYIVHAFVAIRHNLPPVGRTQAGQAYGIFPFQTRMRRKKQFLDLVAAMACDLLKGGRKPPIAADGSARDTIYPDHPTRFRTRANSELASTECGVVAETAYSAEAAWAARISVGAAALSG
jgi:hypothetical protein